MTRSPSTYPTTPPQPAAQEQSSGARLHRMSLLRRQALAPRLGALRRWAERGTSTLELALVAPIFLALILGALDLGQAVVLYNMTSEAAREGARTAIVQAT